MAEGDVSRTASSHGDPANVCQSRDCTASGFLEFHVSLRFFDFTDFVSDRRFNRRLEKSVARPRTTTMTTTIYTYIQKFVYRIGGDGIGERIVSGR